MSGTRTDSESWDIPAVAMPSGEVSLQTVLRNAHRRGTLVPMLRDAVVQAVIDEEAGRLGIQVTAEQLQSAADFFRRGRGLHSAEKTHEWLKQYHLTIFDLEDLIASDLRIRLVRQAVAEPRVEGCFSSRQADFAMAELVETVVSQEPMAQEILMQVMEEGQEFAEVVRSHRASASPPKRSIAFRMQLDEATGRAVFGSSPGQVVGPFAAPGGFRLIQVRRIQKATLNPQTRRFIEQIVFDEWLAGHIQNSTLRFPLLDRL